MAELAAITKELDFHLEQVQDFTPTPMTVSTETFYTGFHPYTLQPVYSAKAKEEKLAQRKYFFWYEKANKPDIVASLRRLHRPDLLTRLYPNSGTTTYRSTTPQRQSATTQRQGTAPKRKGATTHREEAPSRNRRGNYHPHQGPTGSFVPVRPHKKRK